MNTASLIRRYGRGRAWDRAGLYWLSPPMPQRLRCGSYDQWDYVLVSVRGDTVDMYGSDANGKLAAPYARWTPLTRDDGEARGLFQADEMTCTGALEAEGYTVVELGKVTA